jgi:hypothetical protein
VSYKIGDRVGAILSSDKDSVNLFGYGTYQGDEIPDESCAGFMAAILRDAKHANPKIVLDDGTIVWGCECWWGPEEKVKADIGSRTIFLVSVAEEREKALATALAADSEDDGDLETLREQ